MLGILNVCTMRGVYFEASGVMLCMYMYVYMYKSTERERERQSFVCARQAGVRERERGCGTPAVLSLWGYLATHYSPCCCDRYGNARGASELRLYCAISHQQAVSHSSLIIREAHHVAHTRDTHLLAFLLFRASTRVVLLCVHTIRDRDARESVIFLSLLSPLLEKEEEKFFFTFAPSLRIHTYARADGKRWNDWEVPLYARGKTSNNELYSRNDASSSQIA